MPSSTRRLREKFMIDDSDGIKEASKIIRDKGYKVTNQFIIQMPYSLMNTGTELNDAIDFLTEEWDYGFEFI
jgi:hypothetical protein